MDSPTLPVGPHPGWEQESHSESSDDEPQELRSVAESLVVFQSLRQSRNKWLSSAFPKFSAKARGGRPPEVVPPPHSIKAHGRFDVRIGPHIFPDTTFYEVSYLPDTSASSGPLSGQAPPFYAYRASEAPQADTQLFTAQVAVSALAGATDVRKDRPDSSVTVTPGLVVQVNAAASTDPLLKDLLHLAAAGKATPEQQKTLGNFIRSLGAVAKQSESIAEPLSSPETSGTPLSAEGSRPTDPQRPAREFDIVIEFQEKPSDRWIVPRGPAVCERADAHTLSDVSLSTAIRPTVSSPAGTPEEPSFPSAPHVVSIRISKVSQVLWELLLRWSGGEDGMARSKAVLENIVGKGQPRRYLQHRLPDGPLLEQLKMASLPRYNTKPIMPSNADSTRSRRRPRKQRDTNPLKAQVTHVANKSAADTKQKAKPRIAEPPVPIACWSCRRTDVPLLNFGRYCKSCINAGRAGDAATSEPQAYTHPTAAPYQPWGYQGFNSYNVAPPTATTSPAQIASNVARLTTEMAPVGVLEPELSATTDHDMTDQT